MTVTRPHEDRLGTDGTAVDQVLKRTGSGEAAWGSPGGGVEDLLDGDDSLFTTSVGNWVASAGSLAQSSGIDYSGKAGYIAWSSPVSTTDYIEVPIAGTFRAGAEYQAVVALTVEEAASVTFDLRLGLLGTDDTTLNLSNGGAVARGGSYGVWIIRWVPDADRTGVVLRLRRTSPTGARTFRVAYARVVRANGGAGLAVLADARLGGNLFVTGVVVPMAFNSAILSIGSATTGQTFPKLNIDGFGAELQGGAAGNASVSAGWGGDVFISAGGGAAGDKIQQGLNVELTPDFLGFYIGQKDASTVQFYADFGDYDFEFVDGATGRWRFRSDEDGFATPGMGMLPIYSSAPHVGVETEGESYYDTTLHKTRTWDGTAWQAHW